MGVRGHKKTAPKKIPIGIVTASTTRSLKADASGIWMAKRAKKERQNVVYHRVVPDVAEFISGAVKEAMDAHGAQVILVTGGTGITTGDVSIAAVTPLFTKELTAFGPLFAQLSYEQIDSAAIMSRAVAGIVDNRAVVFCMPGSLKACKLACKALIFPELGHMAKHLGEGHKIPEMANKTVDEISTVQDPVTKPN